MNSIGGVPGEKINARNPFSFSFALAHLSTKQELVAHMPPVRRSLPLYTLKHQGTLSLGLTFSKIEERWKRGTIGKARVWVSQLVEVGVKQCHKRLRPLCWVVAEESSHEGDCIPWGSVSEDLLPGQRLDLWESVFSVVFVHGQNLVPGWCP